MTDPLIGMAKEELDTPCLVIDLDLLEQNIKRVAESVNALVRPHTKTHKCPTIAKMQIAAGAIGVTCAKVSDAEVLAKEGITNILIANQVTGPSRKIARLMDLASKTEVRVLVDNPINVRTLSAAAESRNIELHVLIELDLGHHRCGIEPGKAAIELAQTIMDSKGLIFDGLEFYEGNTSIIQNFDDRKRETEKCIDRVLHLKEQMEQSGIPVEVVSGGGTGTHAITGNYSGVTEVRPGTYVFNDTKYQPRMPEFPCALTVLGTVSSTAIPDRVIIDAGSTSLTQDHGLPALKHPDGWKLNQLNEAQGFLRRETGRPLTVGDSVEIIPSHSCTNSNLFDEFHVCRNGVLVDIWPISMRGKIQ